LFQFFDKFYIVWCNNLILDFLILVLIVGIKIDFNVDVFLSF